MDESIIHADLSDSHPIDTVEGFLAAQDWTHDRQGDDEILAQAPGQWCDFNLLFAWNAELAALHFSCAFDIRVPTEKRVQVNDLLASVNEKLWLGHFALWREESLPMFRHVLPLRDTPGPSAGQIADLVDVAIAECDRFYPAFQYVIWGGKTPAEAIEMAMVDTVGEA